MEIKNRTNVTGEIVTLREALRRVGLEGLAPEQPAGVSTYVEWKGYPTPFACGHYAVRGFGPERKGVKPSRDGAHREYQTPCRVSQHFCSGAVLFSWGCVGIGREGSYAYRLNASACVVIDTPPDSQLDQVLKLAITA